MVQPRYELSCPSKPLETANILLPKISGSQIFAVNLTNVCIIYITLRCEIGGSSVGIVTTLRADLGRVVMTKRKGDCSWTDHEDEGKTTLRSFGNYSPVDTA